MYGFLIGCYPSLFCFYNAPNLFNPARGKFFYSVPDFVQYDATSIQGLPALLFTHNLLIKLDILIVSLQQVEGVLFSRSLFASTLSPPVVLQSPVADSLNTGAGTWHFA